MHVGENHAQWQVFSLPLLLSVCMIFSHNCWSQCCAFFRKASWYNYLSSNNPEIHYSKFFWTANWINSSV